MKNRVARKYSRKAFSLVEVAIALGIVTFCLVALFSLLPTGLHSVKGSNDEAGAANCLQYVTECVRYASVDSTKMNYTALGGYNSIVWAKGGASVTNNFSSLSLGGMPTSVLADQRLAAQVVINPPANSISPGTAMISVAWPRTAVWNAAKTNWVNAEGSVSSWIVFLPNQ